MPAAPFTATVIRRRELAPDYFELVFSVDGRETFDFCPGQFVTVRVPTEHGATPVMRAYSIASAPRGDATFDLCVKLVRGTDSVGVEFTGKGSGYLYALGEGQTANFLGPSGVLHFDESMPESYVLAATGTGIAPVKSIAEHLTNLGASNPIRLYFGVRYATDVFYRAELDALTKRNPHFSYVIGVSRPGDASGNFRTGRLPDIIAADFPNGITPPTIAVICGGVTASTGIKNKLVELGVAEKNIHVEGYGE